MTVSLAPLEEELRIVERIRELFTRANEAEQSVNAALKNAELLEQSVLEKAFRGELVPQDPNDEPASVLLERILDSPALDEETKAFYRDVQRKLKEQ